jgi:aquaglyceroporin related protein
MSGVYQIDTPVDDDISCDPLYDSQTLWKDTISEFAGTLVFVYIGLAGVNQSVLTDGGGLAVSLCFAFGLTAGIFVANKSGGHLNPAVSFTALLTNVDFSLQRFVMYTCAQLLGGFVGAGLVMCMYYSYINNFKHKEVFAGTFGTVKSPHVSLFSAILDQFVGSVILMLAIIIIPDGKCKPIGIGCTLGALGLFQGVNGFALNLARDFGPRLVSAFAIGSVAFSAEGYWFWVPMIVPFLAMPVGFMVAKTLKTLE